MSTGLGCVYEEREPNKWVYLLEQGAWTPTGDDIYGTGVWDEFGPFLTFAEANRHLHDNHLNPGGATIVGHPDSTDETCPTWARKRRDNK